MKVAALAIALVVLASCAPQPGPGTAASAPAAAEPQRTPTPAPTPRPTPQPGLRGRHHEANTGTFDLVDGIAKRGRQAEFIPTVDAIVGRLASSLKAGDRVAVLSNGGFGGIHNKLLAALEPKA